MLKKNTLNTLLNKSNEDIMPTYNKHVSCDNGPLTDDVLDIFDELLSQAERGLF